MSNLVVYQDEQPLIGGFWSSLKRAVRSVGRRIGKIEKGVEHAAKDVVHSKFTKIGISGLAIAFPAVGVPAAAALVAADKVISAVDQAKDAAKRAQALKIVANTIANAKAGDKGSQRAVAALHAAQKLRQAGIRSVHPAAVGARVQRVTGTLVDGHLKVSGVFERTGNGRAVVVLRDGMMVKGAFRKVA